jgi:hypothetical protein
MFTHALRRAATNAAAAFLATLIAACGGNDYSTSVPAAPTIANFTVTPAAQAFGGGQVVLSWSAPGAIMLVIDNGVGDVSGLSSKAVNVTANTTFTLTASNSYGSATATTVVTVAAQPAPVIGTFTATPATLPAGGGSVTLTWATTNATTLAIDNGVGVVTGTSKSVNVAADTTFTLTATNPSGAVTRSSSVTLASASTRYLDVVNGVDTNACTQAAPCKTLAHGIIGAPAGSTFLLADGMYSALTEGVGGFNVPDGATLQAIHPGAATLATLAITFVGSGTLNGVVIGRQGPAFNCGGIDAAGTTGTPTLTITGVFSNCVNWLKVRGNVKATMTPGALAGGIYTTGLANATQWALVNSSGTSAAELLILGGVLDGNDLGNASPAAGLLTSIGTAKLTLDGVTVRNWPQAAIAAAGGAVVLRNGTVLDRIGNAGAACDTGSAVFVGNSSGQLTMDHSTLSNARAAGICVLDNFSTTATNSIVLTQSTITGSVGAAVQSQSTQGVGATITTDGASLTNNGWGIFWTRGGTIDLRNSTISDSTSLNFGAGLYLNMPSGAFKLRGSNVTGNVQYGVHVDGTQAVGGLTVDLGTAADPGGNTFTGNGLAGLRSVAATGQFVDAVGNTWIPNQQGADANGRYSVPPLFAPVPKAGAASGANFRIDNATALNL